jgi:membrane fusion protein, multidrug efflux system
VKRSLALILILAACGRDEPKPAAEAPVVITPESVATASMRYISTGPQLSGTLQPQQSSTILAETGGTVTAVSVGEGIRVAAGQLLARISDVAAADALQSAQTAVQSATTAVTIARRDLERNTRLADAGALPRRDIEVARSQVANAEAQLAQARAQLATARERASNQQVIAPVSGIVSEKQVSTGDVVTPGTPLFTIVDLGTLQLEASVPTDALAALQPGTPVELQVRGYEGQTFTGSVTRIAPTVDPATGQIRVYVAIANQGRRLVGGLFAEGTVKTMARNSVVIPIDSLEETGTTPTVTRIRNNVTESVPVRLGIRDESDGIVEVLGGISAGDRILTGPARTIAPGTRVAVGTPRTQGLT